MFPFSIEDHVTPGDLMKRRSVLVLLGGVALGWPRVASTEPPDAVRRLGLLLPYVHSDQQAQARVNVFTAALQERGWRDFRIGAWR